MKADAPGFLAVATSIADGEEVDWGLIEEQLGDSERERALLRSLRVIASIGQLHRSEDPQDEAEALDPTQLAARGRIVGRIRPQPAGAPDAQGAAQAPSLSGGQSAAQPAAPPESLSVTATQDLTGAIAAQRWGSLIIRERVGAGVFGEVYRAYDDQLQREVALKLLRTGVRSADRLAAKVLHEGRLLARVRHPNVVAVYGVESHADRVGLWMEYIRGCTLEQLLRRQGLFGGREAALLGQDLCRALAAVHAAGLIHRDVKTQNVMREEGGRVVLMDFGTGTPAGDEETAAPRGAAGTPLYLAPELLNGGEATVASDIYSLGVLLYHLVTAAYPLTATSMDALRAAHASGRRRLHDARPDLPDAFVQVVERALSTNPEERFVSAGAMQEALTRALAIEAPAVPAPAAPPRVEPAAGPAAGSSFSKPTVGTAVRQGLLAATPARAGWRRTGWLVALTAIVAAAVAGGLWVWRQPVLGIAPMNSVLIMPLANVSSGDQDLAAGVDLLIAEHLTALPNLHVVQYTASMATRDKGRSIADIIRRQQVDGAISGSVAWTGPRAQVSVNLVRAGGTTPVWVKQFDVPVRQAPNLPRDVAREVASALSVKLTSADEQRLLQTSSTAPELFEDYLRGRVAMRAANAPAIQQAVEHFQAALKRDPNHAPSLASLARCYIIQGPAQRVRPMEESGRLARAAVTRALALDDHLAEAYEALAELRFYFDWDWRGADEAYQKALELRPNAADCRSRYAMFLASRKRLPDAMQQVQQAVSLDPMSSLANASLGMLWHYARSDDQAEQIYRGVLEADPTSYPARIGLVRTLIETHRYAAALTEIGRIEADAGGQITPGQQSLKAIAEAGEGRRDEALGIANHLVQQAGDMPSVDAATVFVALGERERALEILEDAVWRKYPTVLFLRLDPRFAPLRSEPRFIALVQRLGLAS
jgi:serine/threonine-protein kinase